MIIDQHQRIHNYLRLSLTERCNLRCHYCMPAEGIDLSPKASLMQRAEIRDIVGEFVRLGVKKLRLTGGEPLVRKDARAIIQDLASFPLDLYMTSNGILLHRYMDILQEADFKGINISLDSLDAEKFFLITRRDVYKKVRENIDLLLQTNIPVKINAVLMKGVNEEEILDFVEWTRSTNISIRFIEFMPFSGNQWDWTKGVSLEEILDRVYQKYGKEQVEHLDIEDNATARNYRIAGYKGSFGVISSVTQPFCGSCNRMRLTANGNLKNCLFSTREVNLLEAYRRGEALEPIIQQEIQRKKAVRGGHTLLEDFMDVDKHKGNRSMILIGG